MAIRLVDHINIATDKLEETRDFFVEVLGLKEGWRPPFDFAGYWLYAGERAIVHMQAADRPVVPSKDSALNHFAFDVDGLDDILAKLDARGVRYRAMAVPGTSIRQAFLEDPNGVRVELNYRPA
jgi:catechol 2,3-dioxygenase-like lactoylglutathione lyase family enzyme